MKQYKKNYELKNTAKDRLEGKYGGAILILFLNFVISWMARLFINSIAGSTMNSVYAISGSVTAARTVSFLFDAILLAANILLGVMNAGIALYFLNIACGQQPFTRNLFYGFRNDSKKALVISAAVTLCNTVCLGPGQYLSQQFLNTRDGKWALPALLATAVGLCIYIPISLGIAMSFFLMLDFPGKSGKETLQLCWRLMKGNRKRLFLLELGFLPLMLLCILSFGIGFLWLEPYMQMTYAYFFLDLMNPIEKA
ncbi:DUF975 family protein [Acetatifactor aquisgranensis]|uniref:DUF975 family protein n=1 Tax=Acetatifactor aquisgranensis TaxID=2941233 RepID=UPI00203FFCD6|nr:DUF975 family protein [Acetatifactor aquisgranensis]